jgi:hypothetical protein
VGGTVLVGGSKVAVDVADGAGVGGGGSEGSTVAVDARVGTAVGSTAVGVTAVQAVKKITIEAQLQRSAERRTQRNKPGFSKKPGLLNRLKIKT